VQQVVVYINMLDSVGHSSVNAKFSRHEIIVSGVLFYRRSMILLGEQKIGDADN
jgi:hypothetical protein